MASRRSSRKRPSRTRRTRRASEAPTWRAAVIYARVSSRDQERGGFSIPAQQTLLRDYAAENGFEIVEEFVDIETAKRTGRGSFNKMVTFIRKRTVQRPTILVEKTDRLYRNLKDWVTIDGLGVEVHLVKEGALISDESRSSEKFMHGIKVLMAKNYVDNLSEEVRKGMNQKAAEGHWPSSAPIGYLNRREGGRSTIVPDPERAILIRNLFELYAAGTHSIKTLAGDAAEVGFKGKRGGKLHPSAIHNILRNPLYAGEFWWGGKLYESVDPVLVTRELWERVQERLDGFPDTRPAPRRFAYTGLLNCGHCGAAISAEIHKGKYIYYRCAQVCQKERYTREERLDELLAESVIRPLQVPPHVADWAIEALRGSREAIEREQKERIADARRRFERFRRLIDSAYEDKLEGRIDDDFFARKKDEWERKMYAAHEEEERLTRAGHKTLETGVQVLELVKSAYDRYILLNQAQRRQVLNVVLSNCTLAAGEVVPTYRKPFDILRELADAGNQEAPGSSDPGAVHPVWSG